MKDITLNLPATGPKSPGNLNHLQTYIDKTYRSVSAFDGAEPYGRSRQRSPGQVLLNRIKDTTRFVARIEAIEASNRRKFPDHYHNPLLLPSTIATHDQTIKKQVFMKEFSNKQYTKLLKHLTVATAAFLPCFEAANKK
jgi:hypothetical protein